MKIFTYEAHHIASSDTFATLIDLEEEILASILLNPKAIEKASHRRIFPAALALAHAIIRLNVRPATSSVTKG